MSKVTEYTSENCPKFSVEKGISGAWYAVFSNEEDTETALVIYFPECSGIHCFGGYMNAIRLTE